MGWIKGAKANQVAKDAAAAIQSGQNVFTAKLNLPATQLNMSGGITDWAVMIDAIEAEGWRMVAWSVTTDSKGRSEGYPVFRRA